jgi:hypothetical protein
MMNRMRLFLVLFAIAVMIPLTSQATIQQLRAQIQVAISLQVTNPLGMSAPSGSGSGSGIVAQLVLNKNEDPAKFSAQNISFVGGNTVAQAVKQGAVQVLASISPNPNGTLLYAGCTVQPIGCSNIIFSVTAGAKSTDTCPYTVTVDTTVTSWTLEHGLFSDFTGMNDQGATQSFSGRLLYNNSHLATPLPAYTPFIVYSDGQAFVNLATGGGMKTYCIDLQVTVPTSILTGTYNSNATYSLYY